MRRTEGVGGGQQGGSDIILSQWKKNSLNVEHVFYKTKQTKTFVSYRGTEHTDKGTSPRSLANKRQASTDLRMQIKLSSSLVPLLLLLH